MKTVLLTLIFAVNGAQCAIDYSKMLDALWEQNDKNQDTFLSWAEFQTAAVALDLDANIFTSHGKNLQTFYNDISGGDSKMTKTELSGTITKYPGYKNDLIAAFTNGAGAAPTGIATPNAAMSSAKAKVNLEIEVQGKINEIYKGTRKQIKEYFATTCGVTADEVVMTFLAKKTRRQLAGRALQSSDAVIIDGTAYVADNAAADAALAALPKDAAGFQSVPAFSAVKVNSVAVSAKKENSLGLTEPLIVAAIFFIVVICLCYGSGKVAHKAAEEAGEEGGCCKTGCCSFYAVRPWAFGEAVSVIILLACVLFLFTQMNSLTQNVIGLLDTVVELSQSTVSAVSALSKQLPTTIIDAISAQKSALSLLPVAVIVPGLFCVIFMTMAALMGWSKSRPGTYCCTKCMIMLGNLFLLLSIIFYCIFAGIAVVLLYAPEPIPSLISQVTGLCDTVPAQINQLLADNMAVLDQLKLMGQAAADLATLESQLNDVQGISDVITKGCGHMNGLFDDAFSLFAPSVTCVVAILFSIYVNNTLCCAAGCCKAKPTDGKVSPDA